MAGIGRDERGITLVLALWMLVFLGILGAAANVVSRTDIGISRSLRNETTAFYVAEAGLQRALGKINTEIFWADNLADPLDAFAGDNAFGLGTYTVAVYRDDPIPEAIRVRSTGFVNGSNAASTVEAVLLPAPFDVMQYASFTCGNALFSSSDPTHIDGNVYASGHLNMGSAGADVTVTNGDAFSMGNITLMGSSSVQGNALANGNISLSSAAPLNVSGDATVGGGSGGAGAVGGTLTTGVLPLPVQDECTNDQIAAGAVTQEDIQGYRDNAGTVLGAVTLNAGDAFPYTGIVHITGNFKVNGDATFPGDVIIVADGNVSIDAGLSSSPPGSELLLLMESSNLQVKNGANVVVDGSIQLGAASQDGGSITGGNLIVGNGADIDVTGSLLTLNGNSGSTNGGALTVTYAPYDNSNLKKRYGIANWRKL
jgi:hypothetical protein